MQKKALNSNLAFVSQLSIKGQTDPSTQDKILRFKGLKKTTWINLT